MLPCFVCGVVLQNAWEGSVNQPSEGTEFQTYGHYGSTFWDSFNGEQIVVNVCDECLRKNTARVGRHQRFRKVVVQEGRWPTTVGREWLDREMVPWFDGPEDEDDKVSIEPEEIGTLTGYNIEWVKDWADIKARVLAQIPAEER